MFKNEAQQITAIRCLLRTLFPEKQVLSWWADDGPTKAAARLLEQGGGHLSHGEAILFRAAFDFWNGDGKVTLDEIMHVLDVERATALCRLLIAVSTDNGVNGAISAWIQAYRR